MHFPTERLPHTNISLISRHRIVLAVELLTVLTIIFKVLILHLVSQESLTGLTVPSWACIQYEQTNKIVCMFGR